MEIKPPKISWFWRVVIALIISVLMFTIIWITSKFRESPKVNLIFTSLLILMGYLTLETVSRFQLKFYNRKLFKIRSLNNTFLLAGSIFSGTIAYLIMFYFFKWADHFINHSEAPMLSHMLTSGLIGLAMSIIFAFIQFAVNWKHQYYNSHFKNEQFKKEIANANLSILKNQLDPHFMFNNFNTLYYLIDEDSNLAQNFLKNVATVYRYILQNNEKSLIPVHEEYEMAKQYLEVIKQRYQDYLYVNDTIEPQKLKDKSVPPLVLQQLIENVIKHNRIDAESPLSIDFYADEYQLTIKNNNNPKRAEETSKIGLENIKQRYHFLTSREVTVIKNEEEFSVSIPLISVLDGN